MSWRAEERGSIPGRGKHFSFMHNIQIGSGAQPGSYKNGYQGVFPQGHEADHSLPLTAEVKNGGRYIPTPLYVS
jgi:hypothetical protein